MKIYHCFLIAVFTLPVDVLSLGKETSDELLQITEGEVILNAAYSDYISNILTTDDQENLDFSDIDIGKIDEKQLFAALHDRYTAIYLNVMAWTSAIYYKEGRDYGWGFSFEKKNADQEKAKKCAEVANFLSWYNEKFTATKFLRAFCKFTDTRVPKKRRLEVYDFAEDLDKVLATLKKLNKIFIEANLEYKNIFTTLKQNFKLPDASPPRDKEEDHFIVWRTIFNMVLGQDWLNTKIYMFEFLDGYREENWWSLLLTPFEEFISVGNQIQETTSLEKKYAGIKGIISLQDRYMRAKLKNNGIPIAENFGKKEWEVIETDSYIRTPLDYKFKFVETKMEVVNSKED